MKQTAVEWLFEQLPKKLHSHYKKQLEQAKAMEKEQIIGAYNNGQQIPPFEYAEQYYNETFKSE